MYLDDSRDTVSTHARPQAGRLTKTISEPHHPLEDILSRPYVRQLFRLLTHCNREGKPLFERICENYDNDSLTGLSSSPHGPVAGPNGQKYRPLRVDETATLHGAVVYGLEYHPAV